MVPCEVLWKNEKELKKYSIYLLDDDLKDRDFEFFIFIDPDNPKDRPPFLKELFNIIENYKSNGRVFALPEHRKELKEWIGTKDDNDPYLTPLNWLKIAIERYPYRLVVITNDVPQNNMEFINKRICFVSKIDLLNRIDNEYENLFLSIYFIWIDHILKNVRNKLNINNLIFFYLTDVEKSCPYISETLPYIYKKYLDDKSHSEEEQKTKTQETIIKIYLPKEKVIKLSDDELENENNYLLIFLNRHKNFFIIGENNELITEFDAYTKKLVYSENISGGLSFFNQIQESIEEPGKYSSKIFLIRYIENSLLRIGICDERFQEWWGLKDDNKAGSIVQSRVMPFYIEDISKYAQKPIAGNGFYIIMNESGFDIYPKNYELKKIWSLNNDDGKIDFLIIHQGILDEWQEKNKSKENLTRKILKIKDEIPFVICTSGRGMPDNLPYGVKFMPFSIIEASMVGDYFEKFTLLRQVLKLI
jgi:hypothetical protein